MNLDQAHEKLRSLIQGTHQAVSPNLRLSEQKPIGPTDCVNRVGQSLGTVYTTLGFLLHLEEDDGEQLLQKIGNHWRSSGYRVDEGRLSSAQPELVGEVDGFKFRALAVPGTQQIHLGGDTPCVSSS